jgi:hypothetical protein
LKSPATVGWLKVISVARKMYAILSGIMSLVIGTASVFVLAAASLRLKCGLKHRVQLTENGRGESDEESKPARKRVTQKLGGFMAVRDWRKKCYSLECRTTNEVFCYILKQCLLIMEAW